MSSTAKRVLAIGGGIAVLAVGAYFLLGNRDGENPLSVLPGIPDAPPVCPLSGEETENEALVERPAVAVKIENNSVAYPLSGLEDAEVVYEELVEGGLTRFMAIYHCTDTPKAGPTRSSRVVDATIMSPYTRILGAAGGNNAVREVLEEAGVVLLDENTSGGAMQRIPREGISMEHTLYTNTKPLRKLGRKEFSDPPAEDIFEFGDMEIKGKKAGTITVDFGGPATVTYEWNGDGWARSDGGSPLMSEAGEQIVVDNVIVEEHVVKYSGISDIAGSRSIEIEDVTGSGRAVLFRDGRAYKGRWERDSEEDPVRFVTKAGDPLMLKPGTTWIELVPSPKGEAKGSFSFAR